MDASRVWQAVKVPLILVMLLALLLVGTWWGMNQLKKPLPGPAVAPCVDTPIEDGELKAQQVSIRVLNGSDLRGKAGEVQQALRAQGFRVVSTGNTPEPAEKTQVVGHSPDAPEVNLVAKHVVGAERVGNNRADHMVEIIIGSDYDGLVADAPRSLEVSTPSICLPEASEPVQAP